MDASNLLARYSEGQRDFQGVTLNEVNLAGAYIPFVIFDEVNLQKADLRNAVLAGANLNHADLTSATLTSANLMGTDMIRAKLAGANLSKALVSGANLSGVSLRKANLTDTSFAGANLSGADLSGAILENTNFTGAILKGANFSDANLDRIDIKDLDLDEAILSEAQNAKFWHLNRGRKQQEAEDYLEAADSQIAENVSFLHARLEEVDSIHQDQFDLFEANHHEALVSGFLESGEAHITGLLKPPQPDIKLLKDPFAPLETPSQSSHAAPWAEEQSLEDGDDLEEESFVGSFIDPFTGQAVDFSEPSEQPIDFQPLDDEVVSFRPTPVRSEAKPEQELSSHDSELSSHDSFALIPLPSQAVSKPTTEFLNLPQNSTAYSELEVHSYAAEPLHSKHQAIDDSDQELCQFLDVPLPDFAGSESSNSHLQAVDDAPENSGARLKQQLTELSHSKELRSHNSKLVDSIQSAIKKKVQASFQRSLLEAYDYHCAISQCDIQPLLEATFILSQSPIQLDQSSDGARSKLVGSDHPSKGLLLRSDLKTLYKLHLIAIDPQTLTVLVAPSLQESEYRQLQGKKITLPSDPVKHPQSDLLTEHLRACKWYIPAQTGNLVASAENRSFQGLKPFSRLSQSFQATVFQIPRKLLVAGSAFLLLGGLGWIGYRLALNSDAAVKGNPASQVATASSPNQEQKPVVLTSEPSSFLVGIGPVLYQNQGIIVEKSAYLASKLVKSIGIDPSKVPVGQQVEYRNERFLKATALKDLGTQIDWDAKSRTMTLTSQLKFEVKPINLEINSKPFPQEGIVIQGSAHIPISLLTSQLQIEPTKIPESERVEYQSSFYVQATKLEALGITVAWDKETRTMALTAKP